MPNVPENGVVVTEATVEKAWLDYNDHMNMAYYVMCFDHAVDAFKGTIGIDLGYIANNKRSTVALESHISYHGEANLGEQLRIETRLVDFDGKRSHVYQEMYRDRDLLATSETLSISFDTAARRSCPFEPEIASNYGAMLAAQRALPRPQIGRSLGIRRGKPKTPP